MRIKKLSSNIIHLHFKTQREMNLTMFRFTEEPIDNFTLKNFKKLWLKKHTEWSYPESCEGYGINEQHIRVFIDNKYPAVTKKEKLVLAAAKHLKQKRYSIICTYGTDKATFYHELTHALYHTNTEYRNQVQRLIKVYHKQTFFMRYILKKLEYDISIYDTEINAYICDTSIVVPSFYGTRRISLDLTTVIEYHIIEQFIFLRNKYIEALNGQKIQG